MKSILIQEMAWCLQTTSHYLDQCRPRPLMYYMVSLGHNGLTHWGQDIGYFHCEKTNPPRTKRQMYFWPLYTHWNCYGSCEIIVTTKFAWWLLMVWHLFSTWISETWWCWPVTNLSGMSQHNENVQYFEGNRFIFIILNENIWISEKWTEMCVNPWWGNVGSDYGLVWHGKKPLAEPKIHDIRHQ